jgi:hypothetical protein
MGFAVAAAAAREGEQGFKQRRDEERRGKEKTWCDVGLGKETDLHEWAGLVHRALGCVKTLRSCARGPSLGICCKI